MDLQIEYRAHSAWPAGGYARTAVGDGWSAIMRTLFDRIAIELVRYARKGGRFWVARGIRWWTVKCQRQSLVAHSGVGEPAKSPCLPFHMPVRYRPDISPMQQIRLVDRDVQQMHVLR